jgi:hydroxyethylthiazole kinase-like uncharacterized protein yjeF
MTELLTAAQMRALEQAAISSGEVTGLELMERAGRGVVEATFEEWPELRATSHRAVVLCGPGNNGGDGFVVARRLKERGWEVEVFLYGNAERLPADARANYERWSAIGEVRDFSLRAFADVYFRHADRRPAVGALLLVDAVFGTGLSRRVHGEAARALNLVAEAADFGHAKVVAVDTPSGLCADSGKVLGTAASANLTVTFHRAKLGHVLQDGPQRCGTLRIADINLPEHEPTGIRAVDVPSGLGKTLGHKFSHGHALIVSGDHGRAGAARLSARGALRIGAGLVTVASPPGAMAENAARLDAIMLREVEGGEGLAEVLADKRVNALCLGPGMGTGATQAGLLAVALAVSPPNNFPPTPPHGGEGRRLVLDADALTILSQRPDLFAMLNGCCILTPHAGEFARLFPDIAEKLAAAGTKGPAYSKVDATREAAARAGCVVLFKGPDTVIADPSGRCSINAAVYDRSAPWLATAGSGDVLAGFITGLLARGFSPFDAACAGAWLHVDCARSFGPGLIAEDLPEELPKVFRSLVM